MSGKEITAMRERQQEAKAAELKAKLDMVEQRPKLRYGRQPRKIGEMVCNTGIKSGYQEQTAKFTLRLDIYTGEFTAEHGDVWYVSKSRDALQAKMDQVARVTYDLKWTRYIKIDYTATVLWRQYDDDGGATTNLDVDEKREKDKPTIGVALKWEVVEYSNGIRLPGDTEDRYMMRAVDEDGEVSDTQVSRPQLPSGLVIYTSERENFLKGIRLALGDLDKRMVALFSGTPDEIGNLLDSANGPLLLPGPAERRKKNR